MTNTFPRRLTTLQLSQILLTLDLTFMAPPGLRRKIGEIHGRNIDGHVVSVPSRHLSLTRAEKRPDGGLGQMSRESYILDDGRVFARPTFVRLTFFGPISKKNARLAGLHGSRSTDIGGNVDFFRLIARRPRQNTGFHTAFGADHGHGMLEMGARFAVGTTVGPVVLE